MIVQTDGQTKATCMSLDSVNWLIYVNIIAVLVFNLDLYNNLSISQMMEEIICFFNNSLALRVHQSLKKLFSNIFEICLLFVFQIEKCGYYWKYFFRMDRKKIILYCLLSLYVLWWHRGSVDPILINFEKEKLKIIFVWNNSRHSAIDAILKQHCVQGFVISNYLF